IDGSFLTNNNAGSTVYVVDERGDVQKTLTGFLFDNSVEPGYLELNEPNRAGFVPDFSATQVQPFSY
ncbi:MAG: hypothetical protein JO103_11065, partial [Candidatus Eremiobacteraeota bacterium]|nr:hypothetical protein [Candidatus Eremiobacteraeota bacterium]MBV9408078.1 hypothetical protein [Candidatus Eremiobacteraeota bacterium]